MPVAFQFCLTQPGRAAELCSNQAFVREDEQGSETDAPALFPCLPNGAARCQ